MRVSQVSITKNEKGKNSKEGQTIREGTFEPEKKKEIWWCYITTIHLMMILHTCEKNKTKKNNFHYLKIVLVNV